MRLEIGVVLVVVLLLVIGQYASAKFADGLYKTVLAMAGVWLALQLFLARG